MEVAFSSVPNGSIFRSKTTGLKYIKCTESKDIYLDLEVYQCAPSTINAFVIEKELCLRPAIFPGHSIVELI